LGASAGWGADAGSGAGAPAATAAKTARSTAYAQALALEQARLRAAAEAQAKAGLTSEDAAPPPDANRERAASRAVNLAGIVVMVLAAAAAAWWFTSRTPRFDDPESPLRPDETFPAQVVPAPGTDLRTVRPPASANATGAAPAPLGNASSSALASATASGASAPTAPSGAVAVEGAAELDEVAAELMSKRMPRVAEAAGRNLARVLSTAAEAREFRRRGTVRAAAESVRSGSARPELAARVREEDARTLNDAALVAYGRSDDPSNAVRLQKRAFAANPLDSEVVGNLAFLHLKERPPQAEAARQLALHALTLNDPRFPSGRIEDWTTLAIASALAGRDADARNAWFASMALTSDLQRQCDAAIRAEATYGERLRPSVQAMLQRARSSAAYGRCEVADAPEATRTPEASRTQHRAKTSAPANRSRKVPDTAHRSHR
jgi:cytoskeletal protein RodZ